MWLQTIALQYTDLLKLQGTSNKLGSSTADIAPSELGWKKVGVSSRQRCNPLSNSKTASSFQDVSDDTAGYSLVMMRPMILISLNVGCQHRAIRHRDFGTNAYLMCATMPAISFTS